MKDASGREIRVGDRVAFASSAMKLPILADIESQSRADLKRVGGRLYWEHPSTTALCVAWYDPADGEVGAWRPGEEWPHHGRQLAAHNATGFDRHGFARLGFYRGTPGGFATTVDTSELARRAGLPGALDALGQRWCGTPKDKDASRFTTSLSTVRRPAGKGPNAISPDYWRTLSADEKRERGVLKAPSDADLLRVCDYCLSDVAIMTAGWPHLASWQDLEPDVLATDRAVNERGVRFDYALAAALLDCDQANANAVLEDVADELGWTPADVRARARSVPAFCAATGAPNAQRETVEAIDHPLARARLALATIAAGKLEAGLARTSNDGRMRDNHRYYGAHTGRWSGSGMQLHNMPRPDKQFENIFETAQFDDAQVDAWICDLADRVRGGRHVASQAEIDLLVRATICAAEGHAFAVCDYSGVEARALAWVSGDHKALAVFASGRDPYKVAAAQIFGKAYEAITWERKVGKVAELACGYGQGGKKFRETSLKMGADLDAIGLDPFAVVRAWRQLHAPAVRFWKDLENACVLACGGHASRVSCFDVLPVGDAVAIVLPSGRPIMYNGMVVTSDGGLAFTGAHGPEHTYGGKLTENVIQALCRDLLADALVRADRAGLRPVLHVHDEIVCEAPGAGVIECYNDLRQIMRTPPDWAAGFPADAKGFCGRRYRK